jgi:glycosyltransferase involved in cell wall biosynthesis
MKIYLNARFLTQPTTGVQRYAYEIIKELDALIESGEIDSKIYQFIMLSPKQVLYKPAFKHIGFKQVGFAKGHIWEQFILPFYVGKGILINLCNTGPLIKRNQILTIHDAAVFAYPAAFSFSFRLLYKVIQRVLGVLAERIVTVSEFSKTQLMSYYHIQEKKIKVVSLGKEHMVALESDERILARHQLLPKRYLLAVSSMNPSKNFLNMVRAIELLKDVDYEIVIAGGTNAKVFSETHLIHSDKVKLVGYVTDSELKALYYNAACFIYPSFYEGFGLPPLEAMACGSPVIVSLAASLPEVCGDASLYCNPHSPEDIAQQIERMMNNTSLRESMIIKGLERVKQFTWKNCARQMFNVIKEVTGA